MFTGIIQAIGTVVSVESQGSAFAVTIETPANFLSDTQPGDSICVHGVCLTVTRIDGSVFVADVSGETVSCTTFANIVASSQVNLELALTLSARLGGHLVTGHIDGVGEICEIKKLSQSTRLDIVTPEELSRFIARKGSVCIDGVSLTVNNIEHNRFSVNIIPHTLNNTVILDYQPGTPVNIEVDLMARYVERLHTY